MSETPQTQNVAEGDENTSAVDARTADLTEFDDGQSIRVHFRTGAITDSETVEGEITTRYTDDTVMIETDDGRRLIVDLEKTFEDGGLRDFDSDETLGRPMFAEPVDEDDSEDADDDSDDDNDDDSWRTMSADECKRNAGLEQKNGVLWEATDSDGDPDDTDETDAEPPTEHGCDACGAPEDKQNVIARPARDKDTNVEMGLPDAVLKCTDCGHQWNA